MAWMKVEVEVSRNDNGEVISAPRIVNVDNITHYGAFQTGSVIYFVDGSPLRTLDSMEEITNVILRQMEKEQQAKAT